MTSSTAYGIAPTAYRLPATTTLGTAHLQIADLERSVAYYRDVIGLRVISSTANRALMGAHDDAHVILALHELKGATPVPPRGRLGLFHVAILLPDRASLGRFLGHLAALGERPGMSDHLVSEAIYLTDPDGLGLEIYADRERSMWRVDDQQLRMTTEPLDVRGVLAAANGVVWTGAPAGTRVGHVHLHVGDLAGAESFYHAGLGLDKTVWQYPGALFLAAGGYHHHLGTNVWARGAESARSTEARLLEWQMHLPATTDVAELAAHLQHRGIAASADGDALLVSDPWGTRVRILPQPK